MRTLGISIAATAAALLLASGAAHAQQTSDGNVNTTVFQNEVDAFQNGQQGTGTQLMNSTNVGLGANSNFVAAQDDVALGGTNAQAVDSTAVGGDYDDSLSFTLVSGQNAGGDLVEAFNGGRIAGGDLYTVDGDAAYGALGAVIDGALVNGGGIAFGEDVDIDDDVAMVGGDGVAVLAEEAIVDDGSALVIGDSNTTVAAHDDSVAVGNGNAIFIDDADDNQTIGFGNVVAMSELDQESEAPIVAGPSADQFFEGQGDYEETFGLRDEVIEAGVVVGTELVGTNQAVGVVTTGSVQNVSATNVSGINDMFYATGAGNQGHIGSVSASVSNLNMN